MKHTLETRLGIFFALALVVAVVILEMIGAAEYFKPGYKVNATFKNVQELKPGDLVKMAGVEIGRVENVELVGNRAKVTMKINGKYEVKTDAIATIKFTGLMGQNFVSVDGGTSEAPKILQGGTLQTYEQPDLSSIMVKLENVASGVEGLTKSFSPENFSTLLGPITDFVSQNQTNLTAMIGNMRNVSDHIAQGQGTVGKIIMDDAFYNAAYGAVTNFQAASGDLKSLSAQAGVLMNQARIIVDQVNAGQGSLGKFVKDDALYVESTNAMVNLRQILEKINQGQGTVGRLLTDESLYKNARMTLQKVDKATEGLEDQGPLSVLGIAINNLF